MRKKSACVLLITALLLGLLSGCGDKLSGVIDEGAAHFSEGKPEADYTLKGTDAVLKEMLEKYAGSRHQPTVLPGDPNLNISVNKNLRAYPVDSDDDLREVFHDAYRSIARQARFICVNGYDPDLHKVLPELHNQIQRQDPLSTVGVQHWRYGYSDDDSTIIEIIYFCGAEGASELRDETELLVKKIADDIRKTATTDYQRVCAVNQYLCDNVVFAQSTGKDKNGIDIYPPVSHTAYGALKEGVAVCEGYSGAVWLLLEELGIDCDIEFGQCITGGGHAWNLVCLEGRWYQMDTTWNASGKSDTDYFLTTDAFMRISRTWDYSEYPKTPVIGYRE